MYQYNLFKTGYTGKLCFVSSVDKKPLICEAFTLFQFK